MLDIVWFMPIMFPVQVTYTTKCYLILYICVNFFFFSFFFKRKEGKGLLFFFFFAWFLNATFRTIVKWARLKDSYASKLDLVTGSCVIGLGSPLSCVHLEGRKCCCSPLLALTPGHLPHRKDPRGSQGSVPSGTCSPSAQFDARWRTAAHPESCPTAECEQIFLFLTVVTLNISSLQ